MATYSIKGGVGKTTSAVNLAAEAARAGCRTLLWDLDPQAAATFFFRVRPDFKGGAKQLIDGKRALDGHRRETDVPGVHLIPADFSMRHLDLYLDDKKHPTRRLARLLEPLADDYDAVILDCSPGITLTSESVFAAVDALLVPIIPTTLSIRTLEQLTGFLADVDDGPIVLPFASMVDRRKKLQRETVERLRNEVRGFLATEIPNASVVERMGLERAPVAMFAPRSPATLAFRDLWQDISARLFHGDRGAI